jgi:hypothetical protein
MYDVNTGRQKRAFFSDLSLGVGVIYAFIDSNTLYASVYTFDISGNPQSSILQWDVKNETDIKQTLFNEYISFIKLLPDGSALTSTSQNRVNRWDITSGVLIKTYLNFPGVVNCIEVYGDYFLASGPFVDIIQFSITGANQRFRTLQGNYSCFDVQDILLQLTIYLYPELKCTLVQQT